jgi:hypothetical protein
LVASLSLATLTVAHADPGSVAAAEQASSAFARISWLPQFQRFQGRVVFEIKADHFVSGLDNGSFGLSGTVAPQDRLGTVTLAIPANLALRWDGDSRATREFFAEGYPSEDTDTVDRSGGVAIEAVTWLRDPSGDGDCRSDDLSALASGATLAHLQVESAKWRYERFETAITASAPSATGALGCKALVVDFRFVPPRQRGNNGLRTGRWSLLSAGIVPMVRGRFFRTQTEFSGVSPICADCTAGSDGVVIQRFERFPSPVHLVDDPAGLASREGLPGGLFETRHIGDWRIGFIGDVTESVVAEVSSIMNDVLASKPELAAIEPDSAGFQALVSIGSLVERLAIAQPGEVQTGGVCSRSRQYFPSSTELHLLGSF